MVSLILIQQYASSAQNYVCVQRWPDSNLQLDSLPVEPGSIIIQPKIPFQLSEDHQSIQLLVKELPRDSVTLCYRRISPVFYQAKTFRDISTYEAQVSPKEAAGGESMPAPAESLFNHSGVNTSGAITRGITVGNRQNLFVNSVLNLQMDGELSENLYVEAQITDQNIPYQPEGNTQQIRDFDNVYIRLYNDRSSLTAGDVVLTQQTEDSYFLKYYKNVMGLSLAHDQAIGTRHTAKTNVSGALQKGQFASIAVTPIEGVQGPYRLRGMSGESFIVVLANSEKIYLDGELLSRGFDRDYVIDYNLGEVTFSTKHLITRFSRIRVDYEYANFFYVRSNLTATQQFEGGRIRSFISFYREKDNPSSTLGFSLNTSQREGLRDFGDPVLGVVPVSAVDSTGYIEHAILYARRDTVVNSDTVQYYAYSQDPAEALYQVSFSQVGTGSYQVLSGTANGRVYEWVGPGYGLFEPVLNVPAPISKQVLTGGASLDLSPFESVSAEISGSAWDKNLYSTVDDHDNSGVAVYSAVASEGRPMGDGTGYKMDTKVGFQYVSSKYQGVDRFRAVDYDRDWGYDMFLDSIARDDKILDVSASIYKGAKSGIEVLWTRRDRSGAVDGDQFQVDARQWLGNLQLQSANFLMHSELGNTQARWFRSRHEAVVHTGILRPGYVFTLDKHLARSSDSVATTLMNFHSHHVYLASGDSLRWRYRMDYVLRQDYVPLEGALTPYTKANEYKALVAKSEGKHRLEAQFTVRRVTEQVEDNRRGSDVLGRFRWAGSMLRDHLTADVSWSTANVRELQREFVFVQVATGEGTHTWRDENGDGVHDLNEFYEAINFDERNYVKFYTPTSEYQNAYQSTWSYQASIKAPAILGNGLIEKVASRLSLLNSGQLNYKVTDNDLFRRIQPFELDYASVGIISAINSMRNTLFYKRGGSGFRAEASRAANVRKSLLSRGFQLRDQYEWSLLLRHTLSDFLTVSTSGSSGKVINRSDFLLSRNFELSKYSYGMELIAQPVQNLRVTGGLELRNRQSEAGAYSRINEYKGELAWIKSGGVHLNASYAWLSIRFKGEQGSYLGYELLEALKPGTNHRWAVNWQQSLNRGLQLNLQYFGRVSEGTAASHSGSVQLMAYF